MEQIKCQRLVALVQLLALVFRNAEVVGMGIDEKQIPGTQSQGEQHKESEFAFDLPVHIHRIGHVKE